MNRDEIQSRIVSMMAETFELEEDTITMESRLYEDLDLDSIDALDMVVKLQELLSRRVSEDELRQLRTVGDVVDMVVRANEGGDTEQAGAAPAAGGEPEAEGSAS